jgi:uncharacterized membrane protein (GlpM family)
VHEVLVIATKAIVGGCLVVVFALISESLEPKRFAGLFSAAPAVALASLTIILVTKSPHQARESVFGMLAGAVGMLAYAIAVVPLMRRTTAQRASVAALAVWALVASIAAVPLLVP